MVTVEVERGAMQIDVSGAAIDVTGQADQAAREGYAPGQFYGSSGMTSYYWVNKKHRLGTVGCFESFDNYTRFDSYDALPAQPTFDTGKRGEYPLTVHKKTTSPDKPC